MIASQVDRSPEAAGLEVLGPRRVHPEQDQALMEPYWAIPSFARSAASRPRTISTDAVIRHATGLTPATEQVIPPRTHWRIRRIITTIVAMWIGLAATALRLPAEPNSTTKHDALRGGLRWRVAPSRRWCRPSLHVSALLSAEYELGDGAFQQSEYTAKAGTSSADTFAKVIDYSVGMVTWVDAITDGKDISAAQHQKAVIVVARRSLGTVTAEIVTANPGYRAVSAMPSLAGGHPMVEGIMVRAARGGMPCPKGSTERMTSLRTSLATVIVWVVRTSKPATELSVSTRQQVGDKDAVSFVEHS